MREHIKYNSQTDFKVGLQLGVEKIAFTKPKNTYAGIERWVTNSMITRHVLGFVYSDDNQNKVFRIHDAAKYSNDILPRIWNTINKLKGGEFVHHQPAEQIMHAIHAQEEYRRMIIQMRVTLKDDSSILLMILLDNTL